MRNKTKLYLKIIIATIAVSSILGYAYLKTRDLAEGPQIIIETPQNGATLDESFVEIVGYSRNISEISLNDKDIFIDEKGTIREEILLTYGHNILEFRAKDRFGREVVKTLELVYK